MSELKNALQGARVLVTGGNGFLGSFVMEELKKYPVREVHAPRSREFDLRKPDQIKALYEKTRPDVVIHMAAVVGGIGANRANPGRFFYENMIMGIELMEQARHHDVKKFVALGSICAYPKFTPVPFKEEDLWNGYPEETNAPYGLAKKMLLVQAQGYRAQYGLNAIFLLPVNLYGPRDNFDLETSHVIPAMIRKIHDAQRAGASEVVFWGDGSPTREFLHARDAARGILLATARYDGADPVNLGSGQEIRIKDLAEKISREMEYRGRVVWDESKPNGQPRRALDVSRARERFGFTAEISFDEGLRETVSWYRQHAR
ncbi:MAG: GDP-L-fucose synthase [Myxococcota bacterium]